MFWGAALRFIFEAYLEIGLAVVIGLVSMQWGGNSPAVYYNNIFTFGLLAACIAMPVYILGFYGWNLDKMDDEEFA